MFMVIEVQIKCKCEIDTFTLKPKYKAFYGYFNRMRCTCTNWTLSALIYTLPALKSYQF